MKSITLAVCGAVWVWGAGAAEMPPAIAEQYTFGGNEREFTPSMAQAAGGGMFLAVGSRSGQSGNRSATNLWGGDLWVLKLDAAGARQWERAYGCSGGKVLECIAPTADGGCLLGCSSDSPADGDKTAPPRCRGWSGCSYPDYWVLRLNAQGDKLWDQAYGGGSYEYLRAIVPTGDGGFLLAGNSQSASWLFPPPDFDRTAPNRNPPGVTQPVDIWLVRIDAAGNKLWDKAYGPGGMGCMIPAPDGGFVLGCVIRGSLCLLKLDAAGNVVWERHLADQHSTMYGSQAINAVVPAPDGGFRVGLRSVSPPGGNKQSPLHGRTDWWFIRTDASGQMLWERSYGGTNSEDIAAVVPVGEVGWLAVGYSWSDPGVAKDSPCYGGQDGWVVRLDDQGNKLWDQTCGGTGSDGVNAALPCAQGAGYWLAGFSDSPLSGNKTAPDYGNSDVWLLRIGHTGPPVLTMQPHSQLATNGQTVVFQVAAESLTQPLAYQWRFNGSDLPDATNSSLTLLNVQAGQAGTYRAVVSNDQGRAESALAVLSYTEAAKLVLSVHPSLTIYGTVGSTYRVEYSTDFGRPVTWRLSGALTLTNTPQVFVDQDAAVRDRRFYRVLVQP